MNIISVIPLTRAKVADKLSYFTPLDIGPGAIVKIPIRSKSVTGIVTESRPAEDLKQEIKKAPYEIRKLSKVKATAFFPPTFVEAVKKLAIYYIGTMGAVIESLSHDAILENINKLSLAETPQGQALSRRLNLENSTFAVQGDDDDRISAWRSLIRQEFAKKKSVVMYVPSAEDAESFARLLTKGIDGYIFTLYGSLPTKKILETWEAVAKKNHPIVIVATGSFAVLPRSDIDTVIIEKENGRGWITQKFPYVDLRHALERIAHESGQIVYRADSLLKAETLYRLEAGDISMGSPFKWRSVSLAIDEIVDMTRKTTETDKAEESPKFRIISTELETMIRENREESGHLFLFTLRKGYSTTTVCDDCETIVVCEKCLSPVVLYSSKETGKNFFMCHICGERRSANEVCKKCGGWRLTPLGIGIDRVQEDIKKIFPDIDIYKVDSDTTKTPKQIKDSLEKFRSHPGSILLGTELALTHLREHIDNSAIISLDSLFTLPDFRISEKIMYTIIQQRTRTQKRFLIQTRRPEEKIFEYGSKGNLSDFYREMIDDRKRFAYPPFRTLIKITIEGKKDPIAEMMGNIQKLIDPIEIEIFPAFTLSKKGQSVIHGLIRFESHHWPNTELIEKLKTLPPSVSIRVDPETLL